MLAGSVRKDVQHLLVEKKGMEFVAKKKVQTSHQPKMCRQDLLLAALLSFSICRYGEAWHRFATACKEAAGRHACMCLHEEDRHLTSAGSIPCSGGGRSYSFSRVGQLSPFLFLYMTVMHCGAGRRMTSLYTLLQSIVHLTFGVAI